MERHEPLLELVGISKSFPGVRVLENVSLTVGKGQVVGLVGENGAGKSTLMKVLNGIYQPDAGEIRLAGEAIRLPDAQAALEAGICMVHQEPKLAASLSISENVFMGRLPRNDLGGVAWSRLHRETGELLARAGVRRDPRTSVAALSVAERQLLQVAKALALNARLIVLDEPTASLTPVEVEVLFGIVRELSASGVSFVYISHHLDEIFAIASRVTVLKDGREVGRHAVGAIDKDGLIAAMVGRDLGQRFPPKGRAAGAEAIQARAISGRGFRDVSLVARKGEILGLAGLVGAGRTEVARALAGADRISSGAISIGGRDVRLRHPADGIVHGIAYIAEDRRDGAFGPLGVGENIAVAAPEAIASGGVVSERRRREVAGRFIDKLNIRTPGPEQPIQYLSGGNQQKCIIARWLLKDVDIIVFDEPTRGIDVGAKAEIYRLVDAFARSGKCVILISSELPEILGLCDRILVMERGRLAGELDGRDATEEAILALALPPPEQASGTVQC